MPKYDYHIFVCENVREENHPKGSCGQKGSKNIRSLLKQRIEELGLKTRVRANSAGCLDTCALGPSVVIYPQGIWYGRVSEHDVEEIIQKHILRGEIIDRLLMPGQRNMRSK
jgi:(2Fe-2S) ferredoxin